MADINMISQLSKDFMTIVQDSVIKYKVLADESETLESMRNGDLYVRAMRKEDTFEGYENFTEEEILEVYDAAGITITRGELLDYVYNNREIPVIYKYMNADGTVGFQHDVRKDLVENRRKKIISTYVEENNYYRMLIGLPDRGEDPDDYFYVPADIAEEYNLPSDVAIHELDIGQVSVLQAIGYIDKLIAENPTKKYLNYLGSKAVDLVTARTAKAFEIIRVPNISSATMWNSFSLIYSQCREYFMVTIYVPEHRQTIGYYDNFIALCIMVMTLQQFVARILKFTIERDFFDEYCVRCLFNCYGVPYDSALDNDTKLQIVQNLNLLVQNKGTTKVLVDIASILGFDRLKIYKYCLVKDRLFDEKGLPIVATKTDPATGREVPDYETMYDVYFKKIDVNAHDYYHALQKEAISESYSSVTSPDPYWIDDDELKKALYEVEYNYAETKYMGVSISYRMTRLFFDNVYALKMLLDNRFKEYTIFLDLPKVLTYQSISIFDAIVTLCALTCKMNNLRGNILATPSKILHVMGFNFRENFDKIREKVILGHEYKENLKEDEKEAYEKKLKSSPYYDRLNDELAKYFERPEMDGPYTAENLNMMYSDILAMYDFLLNKMAHAETIEEYRLYKDFYYAAYYAEETQDIFAIGDSKPFTDWDTITQSDGFTKGWILAHVDTTKDAEHCLVHDKTMITTCNYLSNLFKDIQEGSYVEFHPASNTWSQVYEFDADDTYVRSYNITYDYDTGKSYIKFLPIRGHKYYISMRPSDAATATRDNRVIFDDELAGMVNGCRLEFAPRYASTFMDYLMYRNPALWAFVESTDKDQVPQYATHIINRLLKMIPSLRTLGSLIGYSSTMEDALLRFIRFFKSYTTDLLNMEVIYVLDMKPESLLRLMDYGHYIVTLYLRDDELFGYTDMLDTSITEHMDTKLTFRDNVNVSSILYLFSDLRFIDDIHHIQADIRMKDDLKINDRNQFELITDYIWLQSILHIHDWFRYEVIYKMYENRIPFRDEILRTLIDLVANDTQFGFYDLLFDYSKFIHPDTYMKFKDELDSKTYYPMQTGYTLRDRSDAVSKTDELNDKTFRFYVEKFFKKEIEVFDKDGFRFTDDTYKFAILLQDKTYLRYRDAIRMEILMRLFDKKTFTDQMNHIQVVIDRLMSKYHFTDAHKSTHGDYLTPDGYHFSDKISYISKEYLAKHGAASHMGFYDFIMAPEINESVNTKLGFKDECRISYED